MLSTRHRRKLRKMLRGPVSVCGLFFAPCLTVMAADLDNFREDEQGYLQSKADFASHLTEELTAEADSSMVIGSNIVGKRNVVIRYGGYMILADTAIANVKTKDIEAMGNVRFFNKEIVEEDMDLWQYEDLMKDVDVLVEHLGATALPHGGQKMRVRVTRMRYMWEADHVIGNLETGSMNVKNFFSQADQVYYIRGKYAERSPGGRITVKDIDLSTCPHFADETEHYSLTAGQATLTPNRQDFGPRFDKTVAKEAMDHERYWVTVSDNVFLNVFGIPVLWFPGMALPPMEELPKYLRVSGGYNSDMGLVFSLSKRFQLSYDPYIYTQPSVTYFSKRGWGLGDETVVKTDNSWTQISMFGILDQKPNGVRGWQVDYHEEFCRFNIPTERYELRLEHVTHVTPRLDVRGRVDALSDVNFLEDYYKDRRNDDSTATFASIDYQFERFIPSLYVRPKINGFMEQIESLPELRFDIPRQHLLKGLYYQGENSVNWLAMRWRDMDNPASGTLPNTTLESPNEYSSFRWDMLHMFNYPINLDWLNLIPRAGVRLTYYENTSKAAVSREDLQYYKWSQQPDMTSSLLNQLFEKDVIPEFANLYDMDGGSKFRVIGELGLEANTKISRSWDSVKNAFWELDGARHVFTPYLNYNYNPTNMNPDHILFFDQIDRYGEQNYLRLGMNNTLQTRRGPYYREEIHNWLSMENYFDIHIQDPQGLGKLGDIGSILKFNPFPELEFTTALLFNGSPGDNNYYGTIRNGKIINEPGISAPFISAWNSRIQYEFMKDLRIFGAFNFQNNYYQRTMYSMGSSLTQIISGAEFSNQYFRYQEVRGGIEFPIPIDDRTFGAFEVAYDLETALLRDARFRLTRNFHCWDVSLEAGRRLRRNYWGTTYAANEIMLSIGLTALPAAKISLRQGSNNSGGSPSDS